YFERLTDRARRSRQVDHEARANGAGDAARQHRVRGLLERSRAKRLGDARDLAVDDAPCRLRGHVVRRETGATGRQHDVRPGVNRCEDRGRDGFDLVGHQGLVHDAVSRCDEHFVHRRPALIDAFAERALRAHGDDAGADHLPRYVPDFPPVFSTRRTSVRRAPRSTAFNMSYSVRPATVTAVRASISTPVCAAVATVASIPMPSSSTASSTEAYVIGKGWVSGMSSLRQCASDSERRMPEPCGPVVRTVPALGSWMPRAKTRSEAIFSIGSRRRALVRGRATSSRPCIRRSAGRTKSSNVTSDETTLPGRPKTGTRRSPSRSSPNASGRPG